MKKAFTLAEGATHVAMPNKKRSFGFTLAEVLITLGIIGVVAAITMPTLIQNHQKQVYVTGLKKGISIVSNMFQKMVADEGVSNIIATSLFSDGICYATSDNLANCEEGYGNPSILDNTIPKYLNTVKVCKNDECNIQYKDTRLTCENNGTSSCKLTSFGNGNISVPLYSRPSGYRGYYTNDGMIYYFTFGGWATGTDEEAISAASVKTCIDTNGEKGPNERGRDLFCFSYCANLNGKILPQENHDVCTFGEGNPEDQFKYEYNHRYVPMYYLMQNGWKMDY